MKTNILFRNINQLLIILFWVLSSTIAVGQERELDSEILVYILPDSLELGDGVTELNDITKLKIKSKDLDKAFKKIELKSIKKAFPDFNESDTLKTREDGKKIKLPNMARIFKLKLHNKDDINSVIEILSKEKGVLFAEKHSDMQLHTNDVQYAQQWHLNNTGQSGGTSDDDIDAPEAWSVFNGSSSVKLGVIDTGVETAHDDLTGKSSGDAPESYPYDGYAHGTHVAGISGAKHGNVGEVKGVDANVQIISKKVFSGYAYSYASQQDEPKWAGDDNAYNKIVSAVNDGADVLNNSWGGTDNSETVRMAFAYAYKNGVTSVASMGNTGTSQTRYPAGFSQGIIAVGATDRNDAIASYSSTGNHIDISAPGSSILSTWRGNDYGTISGTSMAAPVVSGIATLLKGYNTNLKNDDIENILKLAADKVNGMSGNDFTTEYGFGRVNAKKALDLLRAPYVLEHKSATGAVLSNLTGPYSIEFYGVDGVSDGEYVVYRYEARKTVTLNSQLLDKNVWGRGINTEGLSDEIPNFGMGFCEVISTTSTTATLRTYLYTENPYAWFPAYIPSISHPMFLTFEYSVLGTRIPPATPANFSVSAPLFQNPVLSWNAVSNPDLSGYRIYKKYTVDGATQTTSSFTTATTYTDNDFTSDYKFGDDEVEYWVVTEDIYGLSSSETQHISVDGDANYAWKSADEQEQNVAIKTFDLFENYPNPFNPTTQISYQLPKNSFVNLIVYNALGQEVAQLVNQNQSMGKYSVKFNASNLPSGVYIYKLQAGEFSSVKKMMLTK